MFPVLCISISTYNKGRKVEDLVKEILKFQSPQIGVVVMDDCSTDNTLERLYQIKDNRLHVYQNERNKGARSNWFESIEHGYGKYVLHLLDRDWIRIEYLQKVIELLEREEIDFGYIGDFYSSIESKGGLIEKYAAGKDALEKLAFTLFHPSGFLVKKKVWDSIPNREIFFKGMEYGIYPHSYLFAVLATKYDATLYKIPMIEIGSRGSYVKYKSKFYSNKEQNRPYWWTPKAHKIELEALTQYAYKYMNLPDKLLQGVLEHRFNENLYSATIAYRDIAKNAINARHYGVRIVYIREEELIKINLKFVWDYIKFLILNCNKVLDIKFVGNLLNIGWKNMKDILQYK